MRKLKKLDRLDKGQGRPAKPRPVPTDTERAAEQAHITERRGSHFSDPDLIDPTPDPDGRLAARNVAIRDARLELADMIAAARIAAGLTQGELADKMNEVSRGKLKVTQPQMSKWERAGTVTEVELANGTVEWRWHGSIPSRQAVTIMKLAIGLDIPQHLEASARRRVSQVTSVGRGPISPTKTERTHQRYKERRAEGHTHEAAVEISAGEIRAEDAASRLRQLGRAAAAATQDLEEHRAKITRLNETGEWELDGEIVGPLSLDYFDTLDGITADTPTIEPIEEWITHAPAKNAAGQWV